MHRLTLKLPQSSSPLCSVVIPAVVIPAFASRKRGPRLGSRPRFPEGKHFAGMTTEGPLALFLLFRSMEGSILPDGQSHLP